MSKYAQFNDEFVESFAESLMPTPALTRSYPHNFTDFDTIWEEFLGEMQWADLQDDRHIASLTGALPWEL